MARKVGPPTAIVTGPELRERVERIRAARAERIAARMPARGPGGRFVRAAAPPPAEPPPRVVERSIENTMDALAAESGGVYVYEDDETYGGGAHGMAFPGGVTIAEVDDYMRKVESTLPSEGRILVSVEMLIETDEGEVFTDWRTLGYATQPDVTWAQSISELPSLSRRYQAVGIQSIAVREW